MIFVRLSGMFILLSKKPSLAEGKSCVCFAFVSCRQGVRVCLKNRLLEVIPILKETKSALAARLGL